MHVVRRAASQVPKCHHGDACVARVVKKKGPNQGRLFYVCGRAEGPPPEGRCDFYKWAQPRKGDGWGGGGGGGGAAAGQGSASGGGGRGSGGGGVGGKKRRLR